MGHIRKSVVFLAAIAGFTLATNGDEPKKDDQPQSSSIKCKLFSVDTDAGLMVVSKGQLGSGESGDNKTAPANPYIVKVSDKTKIHWKGTKERISLRDLRQMNINRLSIPLVILYNPDDAVNGQPPKRFAATEVIIFKDSDATNDNEKPNDAKRP